jgi:hypothetical protein
MVTAKAQFIPTKTIKLTRENFQTIVSMYFESDGWHLIGLEDLVKGEGDSQIDEGAEISGLIVEAAGSEVIDWEGILKCKVTDGVVTAVYTPGIMGAEDKLMFASGDNRFPIHYEGNADVFLLGNMTGRLSEREYERADGSKGRAVSIMFAPNNKDLKVIYDIPLVFQQLEKIADKLPEGAEISRELVNWILGEDWVELPEDKGVGVKLLSSILLPTLGGGMGDVLKLPTLGEGVFKLIDWVKMPQQPSKREMPVSYQLFLTDVDNNPLPNAYYSNQDIRRQLDVMSPTFRQHLKEGRELQVRTQKPYKVGQYDAIKAVIQLLPPTAGATGMKSAAVQSPQLPQGQTKDAAQFIQLVNPVDTEAVEVKATPIAGVDEKGEAYDPIPF